MVDKEKQFKRQNAWRSENREKIEIWLPKGIKDQWKAQAAAEGISLTEWIQKKCQGN